MLQSQTITSKTRKTSLQSVTVMERSSVTSVRSGGLSQNADTADALEGVGGLSQNAVIQTLRWEGVGESKHRASIDT